MIYLLKECLAKQEAEYWSLVSLQVQQVSYQHRLSFDRQKNGNQFGKNRCL